MVLQFDCKHLLLECVCICVYIYLWSWSKVDVVLASSLWFAHVLLASNTTFTTKYRPSSLLIAVLGREMYSFIGLDKSVHDVTRTLGCVSRKLSYRCHRMLILHRQLAWPYAYIECYLWLYWDRRGHTTPVTASGSVLPSRFVRVMI